MFDGLLKPFNPVVNQGDFATEIPNSAEQGDDVGPEYARYVF
jgi:hypothetical protein